MTEIIHKDPDMHCPMCNAPVKKVIETDIDPKQKATCINEYGVHTGKTYHKFIDPKTSPIEVRFRYA